MNKNLKVSVILPVYNAEQYLNKCLESIINQTLKEIEIICVNDGSTDNSYNILQEYATKDSRIKIINQQNQGVSAARNNALKIAAGEYISFVDADDWLELNALEDAYNVIIKDKSDILIFACNYYTYDKLDSHDKSNMLNVYLNNKTFENFLRLNIVIWDKLFKTKFLKENNISFNKELFVGEDGMFCLMIYFANAKYSYLNKYLYNHNNEIKNSLTNSDNAIQGDIKSLKYLLTLEQFKKQSQDIQLSIMNKNCGGTAYYWYKLGNEELRENFYQDILGLKATVEQHYPITDLKKLKNYNRMVKILKKYKGEFPYNIYCKMRYKTFKFVRIFGNEFHLFFNK